MARAQQQVELSVDGRSGGHGAVLLLLPFLPLLLAPKRHYLHLKPSRVDLFFVAASGPQDAAILRTVLLLCRERGKRGNRRGATDGGLQQPHCISRVVANAFLVSRKKKTVPIKKWSAKRDIFGQWQLSKVPRNMKISMTSDICCCTITYMILLLQEISQAFLTI